MKCLAYERPSGGVSIAKVSPHHLVREEGRRQAAIRELARLDRIDRLAAAAAEQPEPEPRPRPLELTLEGALQAIAAALPPGTVWAIVEEAELPALDTSPLPADAAAAEPQRAARAAARERWRLERGRVVA